MHSRFFLLLAGVFAVSTLGYADPCDTAVVLAKTKKDDGWTYKFKGDPKSKESDCTQFISEVLAKEFGRALTKAELNATNVTFWDETTVQEVVAAAIKEPKNADKRLDGPVHATVEEAKKGDRVALEKAQKGDIVQYWMKEGDVWVGHCGVISKVSQTGYAELIGAHRTAGPDGNFGRSKKNLHLLGKNRRVVIARLKSDAKEEKENQK